MHIYHYIQRWLTLDPPGTNHLVAAVVTVALIWVIFERIGSRSRKSR